MQRPANHIFSNCKVIFCAILMIFGRNVALYVIFVFAKWLEAALNTVRPNTVAGEAGHVRLERPIDSSSNKTVCAPKVAEKGPYSRDLINKPLTDPDFCFCCQHVLLFSRGIWEIHAEFLAFFVQNYRSYPTIHAIDQSSSRTYGRAHSVKG